MLKVDYLQLRSFIFALIFSSFAIAWHPTCWSCWKRQQPTSHHTICWWRCQCPDSAFYCHWAKTDARILQPSNSNFLVPGCTLYIQSKLSSKGCWLLAVHSGKDCRAAVEDSHETQPICHSPLQWNKPQVQKSQGRVSRKVNTDYIHTAPEQTA